MAAHRLAPVLDHIRSVSDPPSSADLADDQLAARFARRADDAAFAELVRRHGPLVFGVCRRILSDVHAAEDAFQATFLLLARKAGRLRHPDRLGPWLHGVARRVALRARTAAGRRREVPVVDVPAAAPAATHDLRPILDDAIARLPARDRTPLVLCYFQGLTYAEAARRLHCPAGTVSARLARARARLRVLLTRRGVAPAAGAVAAALTPEALAASVPAALRRAAVQLSAGAAAPAGVLALTKGIGPVLILGRLKGLAAVVVLGTMRTGAWVYGPAAAQSPGEPPAAPPLAARPVKAPEPADGPSVVRTANFIVRAPTREVARRLAEASERERKDQAVRWLGAEMPPWPKPCPLTVRPTAGGTGGATKFNHDFHGGYEILSMDLEGDLEKILANTLPHEVTHTVLAHHFRRPVPRWADEGAAVLSESDMAQRQHDRVMRGYLNARKVLPLRRLLELKEYGEAPEVLVVFAQSCSATRFLVGRKDRATLLRFVERGIANGWDAALKTCYDFDSVEALEAAWLADLRATRPEEPPAAPATKQGELQPIPLTALRREPLKEYRLDAGDLLGVFAEGILGEKGQRPSAAAAGPYGVAGVGYPVPVLDDGTIILPRIEPLTVRGKTVAEVHALIVAECAKAVMPAGGRALVTL